MSHRGRNLSLKSFICGALVSHDNIAIGCRAIGQCAPANQDFEMAVEIKKDRRKSSSVNVAAETLEKAIEQLMELTNKIRVSVKSCKRRRTALV